MATSHTKNIHMSQETRNYIMQQNPVNQGNSSGRYEVFYREIQAQGTRGGSYTPFNEEQPVSSERREAERLIDARNTAKKTADSKSSNPAMSFQIQATLDKMDKTVLQAEELIKNTVDSTKL